MSCTSRCEGVCLTKNLAGSSWALRPSRTRHKSASASSSRGLPACNCSMPMATLRASVHTTQGSPVCRAQRAADVIAHSSARGAVCKTPGSSPQAIAVDCCAWTNPQPAKAKSLCRCPRHAPSVNKCCQPRPNPELKKTPVVSASSCKQRRSAGKYGLADGSK